MNYLDNETRINLFKNFGRMDPIFEQNPLESKILIVDDDQTNVDVLEEILSEYGYQNITSTINPLTAIELYKEEEYDIILLDILMPELDGFEVMEQFAKIKDISAVPILVLSALTDKDTRLRALSSGARDYLSKPFNPEEVLVRIRNMLEVGIAQKQLRTHNEVLDEKVREKTRELRETRLEIIQRLGIAAEYRDNETGLHIVRMSQISFEIGKRAGLSSYESELLLNASPMHDVGKIGIPDKILLKTGSLNDDEWDIMKQHTTIGAKILTGHQSDLLQAAKTIAITHHERWDGSGYPEGLSRQDIPLLGRIVAIADVFDALTSKRPYKDAWPTERAIMVMEEDSGTHFDPMLLRTFKSCINKVIDIKNKYED